ncbi:thiamine phosphate synthase [Hyphomicrobium sp. CS1GBMeth3]|uniref:thiamine phosphate synthase n=1 Tax=Hyphomicrobium sp. CS1GBMeth3 TaxID=1892845 RepID=UPI00093162EC|nr:thiamine phosphate synthase [Hyphomicrobium sp. CS1GBMeth3]
MTEAQSEPRLCLIAAATADDAGWHTRIAAVLEATSAATLILTTPKGASIDVAAARPLVEKAQTKNIAVLISDDIEAARALGADGVHLSWRPEIEDAYEAARAALGSDAIVGADAGVSRHDAMTLGDEAADYVAFSRLPDTSDDPTAAEAQHELVAWWSEVFVVPVVAFDVETPAEAADLVRNGADFIAVRLPPAPPEAGDAAWAAAFVAALEARADAA